MKHLIQLELRKVNIRPYLYSGIIVVLCMLGLLYTFAMIAYVGGDHDAAEFSSYHHIWVLVNALQTAAYSVLAAVMFSTFLLKDYSDKNAILIYSYPVKRKKLLNCKIVLVWLFVAFFMICGTIIMYGIFSLSEKLFPLVPDHLSVALCAKVFSDTMLCLFLSLFIGIISVRIGFAKKSIQTTIIASVVICACTANVISTMSYSYVPVIVLFCVVAFLAFISYIGLKTKVENAEV